jgi:Fe2+ or Zn2+ uptake regulation protein
LAPFFRNILQVAHVSRRAACEGSSSTIQCNRQICGDLWTSVLSTFCPIGEIGQTAHFDDDRLSGGVRAAAKTTGFTAPRPVIEVRGTCGDCSDSD